MVLTQKFRFLFHYCFGSPKNWLILLLVGNMQASLLLAGSDMSQQGLIGDSLFTPWRGGEWLLLILTVQLYCELYTLNEYRGKYLRLNQGYIYSTTRTINGSSYCLILFILQMFLLIPFFKSDRGEIIYSFIDLTSI